MGYWRDNDRTRYLTWEKRYIWATIFFVLALIIRAISLTNQPLSGDEPFSLYHSQFSPAVIFTELTKGNNPPLFELLLHFWVKIGGIGILWARILPLLLSSLTAFFLFLLAVNIRRDAFPIVVSILYLLSDYHLQFAQEIRGYSLLGLLSVLSMLVFVRLWNEFRNFWDWLLFLLINTLLIYTHYFGFFVLFIQTIIIFSNKESRLIALKPYLLYVLAMIVLYLPLIPVVYHNFIVSGGGSTWLESPKSVEDLYLMLWRFSNKPLPTILCIGILMAAFVKYLFFANDKSISKEVKLLLIWFAVPFLGMFLISFYIPMFLDRYLMYGSFAYILLVVYALDYLIGKLRYFLIYASILEITFLLSFSIKTPVKRAPQKVVNEVKMALINNYSVVICPPGYETNFVYYYNRDWFQLMDNQPIYKRITEQLKQDHVFFVWNAEELNESSSKKWLYIDMAASLVAPNNRIKSTLSNDFTLTKSVRLDDATNGYFFEKK